MYASSWLICHTQGFLKVVKRLRNEKKLGSLLKEKSILCTCYSPLQPLLEQSLSPKSANQMRSSQSPFLPSSSPTWSPCPQRLLPCPSEIVTVSPPSSQFRRESGPNRWGQTGWRRGQEWAAAGPHLRRLTPLLVGFPGAPAPTGGGLRRPSQPGGAVGATGGARRRRREAPADLGRTVPCDGRHATPARDPLAPP